MILISGTAVGLSLIAWSLHRCRQQRRQEPLAVGPESGVTLPERHGSEEPKATIDPAKQEPTAAAIQSLAELPETEALPPPRHVDEAEATLFAIQAEMYEPKAAAEELPPVHTPRRAGRTQVAEQLLLWPDADEPLVPAVHRSVPTTMERRERQ